MQGRKLGKPKKLNVLQRNPQSSMNQPRHCHEKTQTRLVLVNFTVEISQNHYYIDMKTKIKQARKDMMLALNLSDTILNTNLTW